LAEAPLCGHRAQREKRHVVFRHPAEPRCRARDANRALAMTAARERRPNADELLARVREEERRAKRGKLTIFFGAAPGVGKTSAMLEAGRTERALRRDVVIGIVETHGRYDTAALTIGLEMLPRRKVDYHGVKLEELDLDAALARRPGVILVDELAHTNAVGS